MLDRVGLVPLLQKISYANRGRYHEENLTITLRARPRVVLKEEWGYQDRAAL